MDKKQEFEKVDIVHLKHLKEMIRDNLVLKDVECVGVSKIYHVFQWVESIEEKILEHFETKQALEKSGLYSAAYLSKIFADTIRDIYNGKC